jgi:proteasome lid subunit RPN8/RPN11
MKLPQETIDDINRHAFMQYPQEACGLIMDDYFFPCDNIAVDPTKAFRISPEVFVEKTLVAKLQAVIHSHCVDPNKPNNGDPRWASSADMDGWMASNVPWGIVATNGRDDVSSILWYDDNEIAPLEGRDFIHGFHDCYSIVRDYFRTQLNIELGNYSRQMDWWDNGQDLYSENFAKEGFVEIPMSQVRTNDVCLFRVRSPVINHAAVVTGDNQILHHLFHRLSGYDSLSKWHRSIIKYIRKVE